MSTDYLSESNKLIESIFQLVVQTLPSKWDFVVIVYSALDSDTFDIKITYKTETTECSIEPSIDLGGKFMEFQRLNSSKEKGELKGAKFTISNNGKFDVKYSY